jgi:prepilin-type N-terminal cleavage/methylation domain-containing protein
VTCPAARPTDDAGVTMIELVVVLTLLSIVAMIGTAAIVGVLRQQRAAVAYTDAQTQAARALLRLDGEIRYAGDMAVYTGAAARSELPDPSLVWVGADPNSSTSGLLCDAVSVVGSRLQHREWVAHPAAGAVARVTPITLVQGIRTVGGQPPFAVGGGPQTVVNDGDSVVVSAAKTAYLNLQVAAGDSAANPASRVILQQFTALNSLQGTYAVGTQCF